MLNHVREALRAVEAEAANVPLPETLGALRRVLGLDDFGALMFGMPDPDLPNLSRVLPRMASTEVQQLWTGASGEVLLKQTSSFVRAMAVQFTRHTHRPLDGCEILDFGCGYGRISRLMYYFTDPGKLIGVDPWERSIEVCRECGLGEDFRQSAWLPDELPVGSKKFDLIFAFSVFTHLSPRATQKAFAACRRYVREDGLLTVTIRPAEYWLLDRSVHGLADTKSVREQHERQGFAFAPFDLPKIDGDLTYGNTSMTLSWLERNVKGWRVKGVDRSLDDPYQVYLFLAPV
jgi:SAM-dependent methyltransferase